MNPYESVSEYAKKNSIDLNDGQYRVWSVASESAVLLCGDDERQGFENQTAAFDWARQHDNTMNLIITGPQGRHVDLTNDDRYRPPA